MINVYLVVELQSFIDGDYSHTFFSKLIFAQNTANSIHLQKRNISTNFNSKLFRAIFRVTSGRDGTELTAGTGYGLVYRIYMALYPRLTQDL